MEMSRPLKTTCSCAILATQQVPGVVQMQKAHSTTSYEFQDFDICCGEPGRENTS